MSSRLWHQICSAAFTFWWTRLYIYSFCAYLCFYLDVLF